MFVVPAVNSEFSVLCQKVDPKHSEGDRVLPAGKSDVTELGLSLQVPPFQPCTVNIWCCCCSFCQQSQLTHYPERKIAEFQLQIEALEKEYKRFVAKLRVLDPSCKHRPWTPRSYSKRRADTQDPTSVGQSALPCVLITKPADELHDLNCLIPILREKTILCCSYLQGCMHISCTLYMTVTSWCI